MTRKPVMHLLVTDKCDRDCAYCCNKQYDVKNIPVASKEEFESVDTVCLTGGEPFKYGEPCAIAMWLKSTYQNIKNVYVYTNAAPLYERLEMEKSNRFGSIGFSSLDGVSVSIKNVDDVLAFPFLTVHPLISQLKSNYLYVMNDLLPSYTGNFKVIKREWQEDFKPAKNTIFRRLEVI
jgi:hypothetical protein